VGDNNIIEWFGPSYQGFDLRDYLPYEKIDANAPYFITAVEGKGWEYDGDVEGLRNKDEDTGWVEHSGIIVFPRYLKTSQPNGQYSTVIEVISWEEFEARVEISFTLYYKEKTG
jgi:hypothetical protein